MPVAEADIKYYLSGGASNSDGHASLGGVKSSNEASLTLEELFDRIQPSEASAGDTEYRCLYIQNDHGTDTANAVTPFISSNTPSADTTIDIGLGTSAIDGTEQTVADEDTGPVGVTFGSPGTRPAGTSLGNLGPGQSMALWLRRTVTGSASTFVDDQVTLGIGFDT